MSIVCVYTVEIQIDNTSTCKYSIILTILSVDMRPCTFGPPYSKILDPRLLIITYYQELSDSHPTISSWTYSIKADAHPLATTYYSHSAFLKVNHFETDRW